MSAKNFKPYLHESDMMDKKKKGEIALAIFKGKTQKEGVQTPTPEELVSISETTGIPKPELIQFYDEEERLFLGIPFIPKKQAR